METQYNATYLDFRLLGRREILTDFDGGDITSDTSDGGALLLRQFPACFTDHHNPSLIEHTVEQLLAQRVGGLALGYVDLNNQDDLRRDPLLAAVVGELDLTGQTRPRPRDRGKTPAGMSTLHRLELSPTRRRQEQPLQEDHLPHP